MSTRREDIVTSVRNSIDSLKSSGQKLTEATIPDNVFRQASILVSTVEFSGRYEFPKLFELLLSRARDSSVRLNETRETVKKWQEGLKALLRYPMDLLLAPNRPELKIIKLASGFYEYQINRRLLNAKEFFMAIGYRQYSSTHSDLILRNTSRLVSAIADIVILCEDLSIVWMVTESILNSMSTQTVSGRQIFLSDVLIARQQAPPEKMQCINFLMTQLSYVHGSSALVPEPTLSDSDRTGMRPYYESDEQTPSLGTRRNPKTPHQTPSRSNSLFSPPASTTQLPPPAITESQIHMMMENDQKERLTEDEGYYRESSEIDPLTASQEGSELTRQMYAPFKAVTYRPVVFSIGENEDREEELPPVMSPPPKPIPSPRRKFSKGRSFDMDNQESSRRSLCHNNSEGDLLGNGGSSQRFLPRGNNEQNNFGIYGVNDLVVPTVPAQVRPGIRRGSENTLLEKPKPSPRTQRNVAMPNSNAANKMLTKDFTRYNDIHSAGLDRTNSSTWAGESHRQYIKQMSQGSGGTPSFVSSDGSTPFRPMNSQEEPILPTQQHHWRCKCGHVNEGDFPQCGKCQEVALWVDTSPLSPHKPPPTNAYLPDRNPRKIENDYIGPNRPQPHPFEWMCIYCYGSNDNRTLECRFCGSVKRQ